MEICVWPNRNWCFKDELEQYVLEVGCSDDFITVTIPEDLDEVNIDDYVLTLKV